MVFKKSLLEMAQYFISSSQIVLSIHFVGMLIIYIIDFD